MAELNGDRRKRKETTMADDVILEIVKRLPHKYAVQCSVLNKNFRHWISQPNFLPPYSAILHCPTTKPTIFSRIWREISSNSTIHHPLCRSRTLDVNVSIIASCNGLFLLRFDNPDTHYFFNPATSEIAAAPSRNLAGFYEVVGLAVNRNWNSPIKLVSPTRRRDGGIRFTVVVPSPTGTGEFSKSEVYFDCRRQLGPRRMRILPVYAHGSLYWLSHDGGSLVAFDVEKEEARLIDAPPEYEDICGKCFGFADGEIHLVYCMRSGIVIYGHDQCTDGWHVKHRISASKFSKTVFFEDELLLFLQRDGRVGYYDVKREVWENIGIKELEEDANRFFFSYRFSFEKVFDTYLVENNTSFWENEGRRNALLELQKLLMEY